MKLPSAQPKPCYYALSRNISQTVTTPLRCLKVSFYDCIPPIDKVRLLFFTDIIMNMNRIFGDVYIPQIGCLSIYTWCSTPPLAIKS